MASGISHYRDAEHELELADKLHAQADRQGALAALQRASIHAALAQVAATALGAYVAIGDDDDELSAWQDAVGHIAEDDEQDDT